jgi:hypothetical protein
MIIVKQVLDEFCNLARFDTYSIDLKKGQYLVCPKTVDLLVERGVHRPKKMRHFEVAIFQDGVITRWFQSLYHNDIPDDLRLSCNQVIVTGRGSVSVQEN